MTELRDKISTTPQGSDVPASPSGTADPLHNLYRMSRTAGLGSGDYVAINNTAVIALLLGLLSVLSLLYPLMLVAAVAAMICAILALVQIQSSNGTQTGRVFATLGLLLSLGLGGVSASKMLKAGWENRQHEQAMDALVKQLNDKIIAKDYAGARNELFTPEFKEAFPEPDFITHWQSLTPHAGELKSIDWGHRAEIESLAGTGEKRAAATSVMSFEKLQGKPSQQISFTYHDGKWLIEGISQLFERKKDTPAQAAPAMPDPAQPQGPGIFQPQLPGLQGPGPGPK